jgi:hypothetical protein
MAKPRIGDVVEIQTGKGLAYALYTHEHREYGSLLRVFGRTFSERPDILSSLVVEGPQFETFFPLIAAQRRKIVAIAGTVDVPARLRKFPTFRAPGGISRDGRVLNWWLWDGEKEWRIDALNEEQKQLPICEIVNDTLLIERIESGWQSSNWV